MIRDEHRIPLPTLSDDAFGPQSDQISTSTSPSPGNYIFAYTCDLFCILGDILCTLYCNNGALLQPDANQIQHARTLSQVMALNGQLEANLMTAPAWLREFIDKSDQYNTAEFTVPAFAMQRAISCRYKLHQLPILLYCVTNI